MATAPSTPPAESSPLTGAHRPLWAPWRYEYVVAPKDVDCFFCTYAANPAADVEQHVIARGTTCFVVLNRFPYAPGHLLVASYRHVATLHALSAAERAEAVGLLAHGQAVLERTMRPQGFNVGINLGRAAGAAIEAHLHWHLVPRWVGDTNFMPVVGECHCLPQALGDTATLLRAAWDAVGTP